MKRVIVMLSALSLLLAGAILMMPSSAAAAPWISGADSYAAEWVKEVRKQYLWGGRYRSDHFVHPDARSLRDTTRKELSRWLPLTLGAGRRSTSVLVPPRATSEGFGLSACYKDGILTMALPKREEAKARRIEIG